MILAGGQGFRPNALEHSGLVRRADLTATNRREAKIIANELSKSPAKTWDTDITGANNPYFRGAKEGVRMVSEWVKPMVLRRTMASKDAHDNPILNAIAWKRIDSMVKLPEHEQVRLLRFAHQAQRDRYVAHSP